MSLAISVVCCIAISACYWFQPDWLAAVTLVPAWCWLMPALVLTGYGFRGTHKRRCIAVATLWLVFTAIFVEEARSLIRSGNQPTADWKAARERGRAIRVVSLNCYVGNHRSAAEVVEFEPDIVLLQESPSREHLQHLARKLFGPGGTFLWGGDTSILARGQIQPGTVDTSSHFVHATVELPNGMKVDVMQCVRGIPQSAHLIVGGDFNAPPRDVALIPLRQRLFDTFTEAGRGWGNTGTNDYPLFRVDQIWASREFSEESVTAQNTIHSDHRMVVSDLVLKP